MRMKQEANMFQNLSGVFAAIHAQPDKTPPLVSHAAG